MPYIPNTPEDRQAMLEAIGAESVDELFASVPPELRLHGELNLPAAMGELALTAHLTALASRNVPAGQVACFLGAGSYDHFIPAVVDFVASRSEFYTAYTPYQPEASQGTLQALFEYQTLVAQLTGMDVSNASMYDAGSAAAEAALMAMAATRGEHRVVTTASVHPEYRQVLATYLANLDVNWSRSARRTAGSRSRISPPRSTRRPPACWSSSPTSSAAWNRSTPWPISPTAPAPCSSWPSIRSAWGC